MAWGFIDDITGKSASDAIGQSTQMQVDAQNRSLAYMQDRDALRNKYGDQALNKYSQIFLDPTGGAQQEQVNLAMSSPYYQAMMSGMDRGLENVAQNASGRGLSRSGDLSGDLYQFTSDTQNRALQGAYGNQLQGLQGLSQLGGSNPNIANAMSNIGAIQGAGVTGQANARAQGTSNLLGLGMAGAGMMYGGGFNPMSMFGGGGGDGTYVTSGGYGGSGMTGWDAYSDERLKANIKLVGKENGHNIYTWVWNKTANALGLVGKSEGVIAQEVLRKDKDAVSERDGFLMVDYNAIGVSHA